MKGALKSAGMIGAMVVSWSIYYAVSKVLVGATGSALLTGFLLRSAALIFLTAQLLLDRNFSRLFHQGKAVLILVLIGVMGFLLDLFANLGYAGGSLSTAQAFEDAPAQYATAVRQGSSRKLRVQDWEKGFVATYTTDYSLEVGKTYQIAIEKLQGSSYTSESRSFTLVRKTAQAFSAKVKIDEL